MAKKVQNPSQTGKQLPIIAILIVLVLAGLYVLVQRGQISIPGMNNLTDVQITPPAEDTLPTVSPTPRPLPTAPGDYRISSGDGSTGPQIMRALIDPHDPQVGDEQTVTVEARHTEAIESIEATLTTDNGEYSYPMELVEGEATNGTWRATWSVDDPVLYNYKIIFIAKNSVGQTRAGVVLR